MQPLWKTVWNFLRKLKMELPFDPAIPLLGLYPKNPETPIQKNLCTPMFIAAQFTIAKYWKQPKSPSANEWIQKLWYIYTMEFYAAERKKELIPFATAWMELESIMLSEISQVVRDKYHMISPLTGTSSTEEKSKQNITSDIEVKSNLTIARGSWQGKVWRGDYRNYYKRHMDKIKGEGGSEGGRWVQLGSGGGMRNKGRQL